ncbi:Gamma-glutamyl-GABA hydrolase [Devosia sp. DBB001]|nr:Gamma-glutamyl-GABA hydrolase [Devosia sp. DBB001]
MPIPAKPVIGVIACNRMVEGEAAQTVKARYVEAVQKYAGAIPLICPSIDDAAQAETIISRLDAILLTGSNSNIEPSRYGAETGRAPFDPNRDGMSRALILAAIAARKPVFGVCRGLQEINIALGGTLVDQRDGGTIEHPHHAPDDVSLEEMFGFGHEVAVEPGSVLAEVTGATRLPVNSVHYQMIGALGEGLVVNARAEDGVVEAVSSAPDASPILAVQWHPEWRPDNRPHDLAFWRRVGEISRG